MVRENKNVHLSPMRPKNLNFLCTYVMVISHRHILQSLPRDSDFSETLLKSDLRSYFDEDEYSEFSSYEEDDFTFMDDTSYTVGSRSPRSSLSRGL